MYFYFYEKGMLLFFAQLFGKITCTGRNHVKASQIFTNNTNYCYRQKDHETFSHTC